MFDLDAYITTCRSRASWLRRQYGYDRGPEMRAMAIDAHAAEMWHDSERGVRDVFPNANSYEGAYQERCPQPTRFACNVVAHLVYWRDELGWTVNDAIYVLTGRKSKEWLEWEASMAADADFGWYV